MRRFLYYISGMTVKPPVEFIRENGLAHAFPRDMLRTCAFAQLSAGPDGGPGVLFSAGDGHGVRYDRESQHWSKLSPRVWFGYAKDRAQRPGPDDLIARRACVEGYQVELGDGNQWRIPLVRRWPDGSELPQIIMMDFATGRAVVRVRSEFKELYERAEILLDTLLEGGPDEADPDDIMRLAELALGVNYRVSRYEISALELLDTRNAKEIADALLDGPNLKKLLDELRGKKNGACEPGLTSKPGERA